MYCNLHFAFNDDSTVLSDGLTVYHPRASCIHTCEVGCNNKQACFFGQTCICETAESDDSRLHNSYHDLCIVLCVLRLRKMKTSL